MDIALFVLSLIILVCGTCVLIKSGDSAVCEKEEKARAMRFWLFVFMLVIVTFSALSLVRTLPIIKAMSGS